MAGIYLNEDNSHYFMERADKASDIKEIRDFILQYERTNVEKMFLCASCQKTNFPTKTGSIIFEDVDYDSPLFDRLSNFSKWSMAVGDIVAKGIDIYSIWIDTLRETGISPWMSMRMNDVHNADDINSLIHSAFYKNNLDYRRAMYRDEKWEDRQLDYMIKEVRDYHFGLVLEYFEKYDFDGLELDWMRFGNHFKAGYEDEGRAVLDDFMRRTKETALKYEKIRGHRIELAARVPVKPESAFDMGMDGAGWARAGYVDHLIPSPFWHTSQADIPVERWKQLVYGTSCRIAPCIEICLRQYAFPGCKNEFQYNSIETIKGAAKSFVDRGADAVYLFNYMDRQSAPYDEAGYREIITSVGKNELMNKGIRRHVLTFNDRQPEGMPSDERLPCMLKKKKFEGFRIHTGTAVAGEARFALLSFKGREDISSTDIEVYANGRKCVFDGKKDPGHPRPVNTTFAWRMPAESVKDGYQVLEVVACDEGFVLDWLEIFIG